jgi:hypothetical protein
MNVIINGADPTPGGPSHALGYYGTPSMFFALEMLGINFVNALPFQSSVPVLKSEAGSLPWGGLYDIKRNWKNPHCGHRDGQTIDLSLSTLTGQEKQALENAVIDSGMNFYHAPFNETPFDDGADHWHATLNQ